MNKFAKNENTLMRFYDMILDETKMAIAESKRAYQRSEYPDDVADPINGLSVTTAEIATSIELLVKRSERLDEENLRKKYIRYVSDPETHMMWQIDEEGRTVGDPIDASGLWKDREQR